jgi:hypothetical protein
MALESDDNILRTMIRHEDGLRDQRLGWLFALNGFLFAALGFAWSDSDSTSLVVIVSVLGVVVGVSSASAMYASEVAIKRLRDLGTRAPGEESHPMPIVALRSEDLVARGGVGRLVPKLYPWRLIPWCLVVAWLAVLVVRMVNT